MNVLPRMAMEAPAEYVDFVQRHLPRLRRDAALVVGQGRAADELYPDVLTDVAARWTMFEVLRRRFHRRGLADAYLRRAFARRARRWQDEQITPLEVEVWQVEQLSAAPPLWSSMALRLAPVLLTSNRLEDRPLAEAAVAWWHAYEAWRRRRHIAALSAFIVFFALLTRLPLRDSDIWYAPAPMSAVTQSVQRQI